MSAATTWLYLQSETPYEAPPNGLYTVGFYDPSGKWRPESDHDHPDKAAERVHYLNGGKVEQPCPTVAA